MRRGEEVGNYIKVTRGSMYESGVVNLQPAWGCVEADVLMVGRCRGRITVTIFLAHYEGIRGPRHLRPSPGTFLPRHSGSLIETH